MSEQAMYDFESVLKPADAMIEWETVGGEFRLMPAGADRQGQPAAADLVDRFGDFDRSPMTRQSFRQVCLAVSV